MNPASIAYPQSIEKIASYLISRGKAFIDAIRPHALQPPADQGRQGANRYFVVVDSHTLRDIGMTRLEFEMALRTRGWCGERGRKRT